MSSRIFFNQYSCVIWRVYDLKRKSTETSSVYTNNKIIFLEVLPWVNNIITLVIDQWINKFKVTVKLRFRLFIQQEKLKTMLLRATKDKTTSWLMKTSMRSLKPPHLEQEGSCVFQNCTMCWFTVVHVQAATVFSWASTSLLAIRWRCTPLTWLKVRNKRIRLKAFRTWRIKVTE